MTQFNKGYEYKILSSPRKSPRRTSPRIKIIEYCIDIVNNISKFPIRDKLVKKLLDYLKFFQNCIQDMPNTKYEIQLRFLHIVNKAIHIDNYSSVEDILVIINMLLDKLYTYIQIYNSIKKHKKIDMEKYIKFCDEIFYSNTPCVELTYELLQDYHPMEQLDVEVNPHINFQQIINDPEYMDYNRYLMSIIDDKLDQETFFIALMGFFMRFLCYYYDGICDQSTIKIRENYNIDGFYNFLVYFGYIEKYEQLQDIFTIDDLREILETYELGFEDNIDYILSKSCCFD